MTEDTIGARIRAQRKERCMTQAQLAAAVGCWQKDISRWEKDCGTPSVYALKQIAQALGCLIDDLVP